MCDDWSSGRTRPWTRVEWNDGSEVRGCVAVTLASRKRWGVGGVDFCSSSFLLLTSRSSSSSLRSCIAGRKSVVAQVAGTLSPIRP
jgi:hypothetical protein